MADDIETAPTGRAKCRGCGRAIGKGELRFGERQPNVFADGEMTLWFHLVCAAYKRPQPMLAVLEAPEAAEPPDAASLRRIAETGAAHRRLPRLNGAERAPTGRATCRSCRERIERGVWRISLVYFEEGRFEPSGFIHAACARTYFELGNADARHVLERIRHFSPEVNTEDLAELERTLT